MNEPGAAANVTFPDAGVYYFKTKAGEDYTSGVKTVGADHTLILKVVVSS